MTDTLELSELRAPESWVRRYVSSGAWRSDSVVDDLRRWATTTPEATAIVSWYGDGQIQRISYREYQDAVDRYTAALRRLGVGPGQVVSLWVPSRWPVPALMLACWQAGAVAAPVMTTIGPRELERMLARLGTTVCITVDEFAGTGHAELLREAATNLPNLAHQVVLGVPGDGQLSFDGCFETAGPAGEQATTARVDPDRVSMVLFTSGTTGEPRAALHTLNTMSFYTRDFAASLGLSSEDRIFTPHVCTHIAGLCLDLSLPLSIGAAVLMLDQWDPAAAAELMAAERTSLMMSAPAFIEQLLDALAVRRIGLPSLRYLYGTAASIPKTLMSEVPHRLGVPLRAIWAMTEAGSTFARPRDPVDVPPSNIGRAAAGLDLKAPAEGDVPVSAAAPGRLLVRGPGVCVATAGRDSGAVDVIADRDDGWYDTGDLAIPDGRGGYELMGRAADRIGGAFMIPVADVEDALREHPAVGDVALIGAPGDPGQPGGPGAEIACAVVQPANGQAPELADLRAFLLTQGMTEWYLPQRIEIVDGLPRNATGKVEKKVLRDRLASGEAHR